MISWLGDAKIARILCKKSEYELQLTEDQHKI